MDDDENDEGDGDDDDDDDGGWRGSVKEFERSSTNSMLDVSCSCNDAYWG